MPAIGTHNGNDKSWKRKKTFDGGEEVRKKIKFFPHF